MIYLTDDDLLANSYQRFITESTADEPGVTDMQEKKAVEIAKTYMAGRYNVAAIFNEATPIRNELLVDILTKIVLHKIFSRNAARKVPADSKENYDWAIKELSRINSGATQLKDLPPAIVDDGGVPSNTLDGNLSNRDFYI